MGFVAGFTGEAIEKEVKKAGIDTDFVHLQNGFTRINVKIKPAKKQKLTVRGRRFPKKRWKNFMIK